MENEINVNYNSFKNVLNEKEVLENENERLEEAVEQLQKELQQEKADHSMDNSRIIFAHYILNGCRDDKVLLHMDEKERKVIFLKMKYDKVFSEMEHYKKLTDDYQIKIAKQNDELIQYQKSNKAWQEKYDKLFQMNQEALGAIRELENHIDQCLDCRPSIKRCCK